MGMSREEAIFCEKSYIGETNCVDCKYYGTETCQSRESHKMAIKALEQEPFKPMVEIDLYSVIKQKYIEREVLDKIRAEILDFADADAYGDVQQAFSRGLMRAVQVIDRYKAESEDNPV